MVASRMGFRELVEKATSPLIPSGHEDMALNLEVCDFIRSKAVTPLKAMQELKTRIEHTNPNVQILALSVRIGEFISQLSDTCIKNSGTSFLGQIASREFMDSMTSILRERPNLAPVVKAKMLQCLQDWKHFADARPNELGYIKDVVRQLEQQGYEFPPPDPIAVAAASVLTDTLVAPEWNDNNVCTRCRAEFGTFLRKHHCRNCGRVFCYKCSSKSMPLPWYSIEEPVRVCDGCAKRKGPVTIAQNPPSSTTAAVPRPNEQQDDDLARAIALSLQEQNQPRSGSTGPVSTRREGCDTEEDPDLAAAIAASLKEWDEQQKREAASMSHAPPVTTMEPLTTAKSKSRPHQRALDVDTMDLDNILTFSQTVTQSNAAWKHAVPAKGLPLPIQNMQDKASASRGRLVRQLDFGHRRLRELSTLHEKLSEVVRMYDQLLDTQFGSTYSSGAAHARSSNTKEFESVASVIPSPRPLSHHDHATPPPSLLRDTVYTHVPLMNASSTPLESPALGGKGGHPPSHQDEALLIDL